MKRRSFFLLVIVCLVAAVDAWLWDDFAQRHYSQTITLAAFPNLADNIDKIHKITITTKENQVNLIKQEKQWRVVEADHYLADQKKTRKFLRAMMGLTLQRKMTALPERHIHLGLVDPQQGGKAIKIDLYDARGRNIAAGLFGALSRPFDESGLADIYFRFPDVFQSWQAQISFSLAGQLQYWLDRQFAFPTMDEIKNIVIRPARKGGYRAMRAKPEDDFTLRYLNRKKVRNQKGVERAIRVLAFLAIENVKKADKIDFRKAIKIEAETFQGLHFHLRVKKSERQYWITMMISSKQEELRPIVEDFNHRSAGWAFAIGKQQGEIFAVPVAKLSL